jgi:peptide-methionine (R)-S-oxide reductase
MLPMENLKYRPPEVWRRRLSREQYRVMVKKMTEIPFTGAFWVCHDKGIYRCAACNNVLFKSEDKFDSFTGLPSFVSPANPNSVDKEAEMNDFIQMIRTEMLCHNCGLHIGYVYSDSSRESGKRFAANSIALKFEKTT